MRVTIDDITIDKVLAEHKGDEQLADVLKRLKIVEPPNANWPADLHETKLFELYGSRDWLKITEFGWDVKRSGGLVKYKLLRYAENVAQIEEKKIDREIKELTVKQLKGNIFQLKGWWWLLLISSVISFVITNFERVLNWFK